MLPGLPACLIEHDGLNPGFTIAQMPSAALASENKSLARLASVDLDHRRGVVEHRGQAARCEDCHRHVVFLVRRDWQRIEWLCAAQAVSTGRAFAKCNRGTLVRLRMQTERLGADRSMAPDIEAMTRLVEAGVTVPA